MTRIRMLAWPAILVSSLAVLAAVWRMDGMSLGGDDSRLYYLFPQLWSDQIGRYAWYSTFSGYSPQFFFLPFTALIDAISRVGLHPQSFLWAINLVGGFTFAFLLIERLSWAERRRVGALIGAAAYALAPIVVFTQWVNLLYSMYWILLLPGLLYFLVRAVQDHNMAWLLGGVPLVLLFAPAVSAAPWSAAAAVTACIFMLLVGPVVGRLRTRVLYGLVYAALLAGVSAFWLVPQVGAVLDGNLQAEATVAESGRVPAAEFVETVGATTSLVDTLGGHVSRGMMEAFDWPQRALAGPAYALLPLNLLLLGAGVMGFLAAPAGPGRRCIAAAALTALGLSLLLSNAFGLTGAAVRFVPGWTMFRNFYDKFAIPQALFIALVIGLGVPTVLERARVSKKLGVRLSTLVLALLGIQGSALLGGSVFRLPIASPGSATRVVAFPNSLVEASGDIASITGGGGVLHAPLLSPEWTTFRGSRGDGAYLGISPMKLLTGKSPFAGRATFENGIYPELPEVVQGVLSSRDPAAVQRLLAWLGTDRVVVDRTGPSHLISRYGWLATETAEWEPLLVAAGARKTWDDARRAVYALPADQIPPSISAVDRIVPVDEFGADLPAQLVPGAAAVQQDDLSAVPGMALERPHVTFRRVSPVEYHIRVVSSGRPFLLVFNQGFDPNWHLYEADASMWCQRIVGYPVESVAECIGDGDPVSPGSLGSPLPEHLVVNGYQNGWVVSPEQGRHHLVLYYYPQRLFGPGAALSAMTVAGALGVALAGAWRGRRRIMAGRAASPTRSGRGGHGAP